MHLSDLQAFLDVAEHGSFAAAARHAGVPKSTVSRRVARLEDRLGVPLLVRGPLAVQLTDDGRMLFRTTSGPLSDIRMAEQQLIGMAEAPAGRLTVNAPHDIAATDWFCDRVARYCASFPEVEVVLRLSEHVLDLPKEGIDVAISPRRQADDQRLITRRCGTMRGGVYAPRPQDATTLADLAGQAAAVHLGMTPPHRWSLRGPSGRQSVDVHPVLHAHDLNVLAAAVRAGVGMALLPERVGAPLVERGEAFRLLPDWSAAADLWLLWPESRHLSSRVRSFVNRFPQPPREPLPPPS